MKNIISCGAAAVFLAACALSYHSNRDNTLLTPSERLSLRDAVASPANGGGSDSSAKSPDLNGAGEAAGQIVQNARGQARAAASGGARVLLTGYVGKNDPSAGKPSEPVEFVAIAGGKFAMGTEDGAAGFKDAKPIREVAIDTFEMSKTLVTVEQYAECVIKGGCTEPETGGHCNWGVAGRQHHPINCVDWDQANQYAKFKGARLPSEAEYEYAATSGGRNQKYPWGNEDATSDRAVMSGDSTMPVCSKPAGNTAQGLCDMAGNVWEWMRDTYQDSYSGAPPNGSAFEGSGSDRVVRGGSYDGSPAGGLRADRRGRIAPGYRLDSVGFRLARPSR